MKKIMTALVALMTFIIPANAMSYEQAREQALFLTDKMAYELNLTEDQYEAAYEVNLDYLMSIGTYDDLYGVYWRNRNLDMSYILLDWQYNAFCAASYFYRPLYWSAGVWHFGVYSRYPNRTYLYFGRPHFYATYVGGHSWRMNGGRSWYHGRTYGLPHRNSTNNHGYGMQNRFHRGDYKDRGHGADGRGDRGHGNSGNVKPGNNESKRTPGRGDGNGSFRGNRNSSTRTTAPSGSVNDKGTSAGGSNRSSAGTSSTPSNRFNSARSSQNGAQYRGAAANRSSSSHNFSGSQSSGSSRGGAVSRGSASSSRGSGASSGSGNGGSRGGGNFGGRR